MLRPLYIDLQLTLLLPMLCFAWLDREEWSGQPLVIKLKDRKKKKIMSISEKNDNFLFSFKFYLKFDYMDEFWRG